MKKLVVALTGNPNAGKTTVFNGLTGAHQRVANWPGVTVARKEGRTAHEDYDIHIVDLPGTYSISARSLEELIARDFLLENTADLVLDIIDSTNLERNLYLLVQLLELGQPIVVAANMMDEVKKKGIEIDFKKLSQLLGIPFVPVTGKTEEGIDELKETIVNAAAGKEAVCPRPPIYSNEIEREINNLASLVEKFGIKYPARWVAIALLENDEDVSRRICGEHKELLKQAELARKRLTEFLGDDPAMIIVEQRYGYIAGAIKETVKQPPMSRLDFSDHIDTVLTNRILGLPLFLFFIWLTFEITFRVGAYPQAWLQTFFDWLSNFSHNAMGEGIWSDLISRGVIDGVGSVAAFLPNILLLFLCIALFEDTGYMARMAFLVDRVMHAFGLHGKSFISLFMGFGCNVPAIMATRTLENPSDRIITILVNPFMSCSARLPVYVLLIGTFFPAKYAGSIFFGIYLFGAAVALLSAKLFRSIFFKDCAAPFIMELPPYRIPTTKSVLIHMWQRTAHFLKRMGVVILAGAVVVWFLSSFPRTSDVEKPDLEQTYLANIGKTISPVLEPAGFDWKDTVALMSGFVAKEIVVSTLGVLYGDEQEKNLKDSLRRVKSSKWALAFALFVLLYTPCLGTLMAIWREAGLIKWMFLSVGYSLTLAWLIAFGINTIF